MPRAQLISTGDIETDEIVNHTDAAADIWRLRQTDLITARSMGQWRITAISDPALNNFLEKFCYLLWQLKRANANEPAAKPGMHALFNLLRYLRGLNLPLPYLERSAGIAAINQKGLSGRLNEWLEKARVMSFRHEESALHHKNAMKLLDYALSRLIVAKPGRAKALLSMVMEAAKTRRSVLVLVGSDHEAEKLTRWFDWKLTAQEAEYVHVQYMDGNISQLANEHSDVLIIASPLTPPRMVWLNCPATRRLAFCHPYEKTAVQNTLRNWWEKFGMASANEGDKVKLWSLEWPQRGRRYLDQASANQAIPDFPEDTLINDGDYPITLKVQEIEHSDRHADWLEKLLADMPAVGESVPYPGVESDRVSIELVGPFENLSVSKNRSVLRLAAEGFEEVMIEDLTIGDEILLLLNNEERVATQRSLFRLFADEYRGLEVIIRVAGRWNEYVVQSYQKLGSVRGIVELLARKKVKIGESAVRKWLQGMVIGPQDARAVTILAEASGAANPDQIGKMVANAIATIRAEHIAIGRAIRKAILSSRDPLVSWVKIGRHKFDRSVFDAMVEIVSVKQIWIGGQNVKGVSDSLVGVAKSIHAMCEDRLDITAAGYKSLRDSKFEDVEALRIALELCVDRLYHVFEDKSIRLADVIQEFGRSHITYAGDMSTTTKGKFSNHYYRSYNGQKVDISRHLRIGNRHDQRFTMRIHFHWDESSRRIVIHHAGEHLPT